MDYYRRAAHVPAAGELAWDVEFLCRHHRKHIFSFTRKPSLEPVSRALLDLRHKVGWRQYFKERGKPMDEWRHIRSKPPRTVPYSGELDVSTQSFIQDVYTEVWKAAVLSKIRHRRPPQPALIRQGLLKIRAGLWGILPTDKDGGFAIMRKSGIQFSFDDALQDQTKYKYIEYFDPVAVLEEYRDVAREISMYGEDDPNHLLFRHLVSSVHESPQKVVYRLGATAKTHKPAGSCKLRVLHCMQRQSPLAPMMHFVSAMLRPKLSGLYHIIRDSTDFLAKIKSLNISSQCILVKVDVKEYFMSGTHDILVQQSSKFFDGAELHRYRDALKCVLENQFVSQGPSSPIFQVTCGSGMGVSCSGEVSDAALYFLAEHDMLADSHFRFHCGLKAYFRFKDDIVAVLDGPRRNVDAFKIRLAASSRPFVVEVETVSEFGVPFLDVFISKPRNLGATGVLDYSLYQKRTSQWLPLSSDSMHHPSIHEAWPKQMISRYRRLCKSSQLANEHVCTFLAQLRRAGACPSLLNQLANPSLPKPSKQRGNHETVYLVLPCYPQWLSASLGKIIRRLNAVWASRLGLAVRLSWRLGDPHIGAVLKRHNDTIQPDALDYKVIRAV